MGRGNGAAVISRSSYVASGLGKREEWEDGHAVLQGNPAPTLPAHPPNLAHPMTGLRRWVLSSWALAAAAAVQAARRSAQTAGPVPTVGVGASGPKGSGPPPPPAPRPLPPGPSGTSYI